MDTPKIQEFTQKNVKVFLLISYLLLARHWDENDRYSTKYYYFYANSDIGIGVYCLWVKSLVGVVYRKQRGII